MQGDIRSAHQNRTAVRPRPGLPLVQRHVPRVERVALHPIHSASNPPAAQKRVSQRDTQVSQGNADSEPQKAVIEQKSVAVGEQRMGLKIKRRKFVPRPHTIMYTAAAFMFLSGIGISVQGFLLNKQVTEQSHVLAAKDESGSDTQESSTVPSEEKPKGNYIGTYKVAAALPRILSIPSLGVKSRVLQAGVSLSNEMQTPKNIYDTAWYNGSSKPGEAGAMVIDGHYSGPTTNGVFSKLERLKVGAQITVERGDGKIFTYDVMRVETKKVADIDMSSLLVSVDTARPGLNLITCGGQYNSKTSQFSDRTVVYALQK